METPLRGRSDGHTGTAPTVSFGQIARGWLISFGWIVCKWLFCLCGIAWKNMMEMGRGGACVPARAAPQGRIHRLFPAHNTCVFLYGNAAVRTFGRAHRHRPYAFRLGGLCVERLVSFGQVARGMGDFVWGGLRVGAFVCLLVGENGAQEPTPSVLYFCQPRVADDRRLPWVKSWRGTYAIGIVLFKINFRMGKSFAACGDDVR